MATTNGLFFVICYRDGLNADTDLSQPLKVICLARDGVRKVTPVATGKKGSIIHYQEPSQRQWKQYRVMENPNEVHSAMNPDATDPYSANYLALALSSTGATQGAALALTKYFNQVTGGTTSSADGVKLPTAAANAHIQITNQNVFALDLWPFSGDKINDGSADAQGTIPANSRMHLYAIDTTNWYTVTDPNV